MSEDKTRRYFNAIRSNIFSGICRDVGMYVTVSCSAAHPEKGAEFPGDNGKQEKCEPLSPGATRCLVVTSSILEGGYFAYCLNYFFETDRRRKFELKGGAPVLF